ncbi:MAG: MAPEG family protein [Ancalomicrobiaceae bacterium]|nr:MAPEG family protein [Ancalomicrobiaceae bacterium]
MTLADKLLIAALLTQIIWTFAVGGMLGRARFGAATAGRIKGDIALGSSGWPDDVRKVSNNFTNQFETPTVFSTLVLLVLHLHVASLIYDALGFLYVASRIGHTYVHVTSNNVIERSRVFFVGVAALVAMTAIVVIDLIFGIII